ncbi:MAG TPA: WhiB family transcriptional regulator [Beutenbergiaceae bacterium]|nr:WhiB family transcriptional regulator [Beutenbergiaceae bacterium]
MTREQAHLELMHAIQAAPTKAPCVALPVPAWVSDDLAEQSRAAKLCQHCPVLTQCRTYLHTYGERAGVWAGTTLSQRWADTGKPKENDP